ncbi:hypothetical protein EDD36DRAFT_432033 [Exophiala viscosa]|uniref:Amine oxidase n=1 Tax=Exophiala viscosa TaxID=2486360 RepID=A0AAN6IH11_9EURO|nr:hypothetical protein EDD36DRAFT_432033 [Exophiala viscosa]
MIRFLEDEHHGAQSLSAPARVAMVQVFLGPRDSDHFYQLKVDVSSGKILEERQLKGCHPHVDATDMRKAEQECLKDPEVQAAIKSMHLPEGATINIEPWTYGTDGMNDMSQKITMVC